MTPEPNDRTGPGTMFPGLFFAAAARPHLLLPAWMAALTGASFQAVSTGVHPPASLQLTGLTGWSMVLLAVNLANLLSDRESDLLNAKNLFPWRILEPRTVAAGTASLALAGLLLTAWLRPRLLFPAVLTLGLGLAYSLPPVRLSSRPGWDLAAHLMGYGLLAPWVGALLVEDFTAGSNWSVTPALGVPGPAAAYLLPLVGVTYLLTALLDLKGDRIAGKETSAVALARRWPGFETLSSLPVVRSEVIAWIFLGVILAGIPGLRAWPETVVPLVIWLGLSYGLLRVVRKLE